MRKILLVALTAAAMVSCSENEEFENGSTANKWIEAFIKDGKLCRIEQGKYRKIF